MLGSIAWFVLLTACHRAGDVVESAAPDAGDGEEDAGDTESGPEPDCEGAGVWLDQGSGRCWEKVASEGMVDGWNAASHCDDLSLAGYGDWELPSVDDLRSLVRGCEETQTDGDCAVESGSSMDDWEQVCEGCTSGSGPAAGGCYWPDDVGGTCEGWYWSSTVLPENSAFFWSLNYEDAEIAFVHKDNGGLVRCVRGAI